MLRALELATTPGVPLGPEPRAACVIFSGDGTVVAEGYYDGSGAPHAAIAALGQAAEGARGTTAVTNLEPCHHEGGSCADALIDAGIRRVVFGQASSSSAGSRRLMAAGVIVEEGFMAAEAQQVNRAWTFGVLNGRPFVTWKFAASLDGRSAAPDGTSRWVAGRAARADTHRLRAETDTMLVGTQTIAIDDPRLTVRDEHDRPLPHQPLRAVMGLRDLDRSRRVFDNEADTVHLRTRDPREALGSLFALGRRHVFLEGGPTLAAAFLREHLVDEIVAYIAPILLGDGLSAVSDVGVTTIADALRPIVKDIKILGGEHGDEQPNVRLTLQPR